VHNISESEPDLRLLLSSSLRSGSRENHRTIDERSEVPRRCGSDGLGKPLKRYNGRRDPRQNRVDEITRGKLRPRSVKEGIGAHPRLPDSAVIAANIARL
jgi:hypothetical protein